MLPFFSFCWEYAFCPILTICTILPAHPFDWGWYGGVLYGLHPTFSNHELRSPSQHSGALSDTRVFGIPFLENKTLRIFLIVKFFLSGTRIIWGQSWKKVSTSINKGPTSVMYAWSICTRLYGSISLGHECKEVCVKFLNSFHFLHLFIYCMATMLLILAIFVWPLQPSGYHHVQLLSRIFFMFLGELSDPHYKPPHVLSLTYVLFLCKILPPRNNLPMFFFFLLPCLVLDHIKYPQPFYP